MVDHFKEKEAGVKKIVITNKIGWRALDWGSKAENGQRSKIKLLFSEVESSDLVEVAQLVGRLNRYQGGNDDAIFFINKDTLESSIARYKDLYKDEIGDNQSLAKLLGKYSSQDAGYIASFKDMLNDSSNHNAAVYVFLHFALAEAKSEQLFNAARSISI